MSLSKGVFNEREPLSFGGSVWKTLYEAIKETVFTWFSKIAEEVFGSSTIISTLMSFVHIITSSLISVIVIVKEGTGYFLKFMGSLNLVSLIYLIINRIKEINPSFDTKVSEALLVEYMDKQFLAEDNIVIENSLKKSELDFSEQLTKILTLVFSVIIAGFGLAFKGINGITETFRMVTSVKVGFTNLKTVVNEVLSQFISETYDQAYAEKNHLIALIEEVQLFLRMSLGEIAKDNKKRSDIKSLLQQITHALSLYHHSDTSNLRSLLSSMVKDLNKRLEEVDNLPGERQVTTGIFLTGDKGVGKSTLVNYLVDKLAKVFNYQNKLYNVTPGVRFYEPYLNEDFGICNEFNSVVEKNQFVLDANKICSADPFNFESAALTGKVASCQLKALFVTSNTRTADIPELREHAIPAFWDRFIILEVCDPLIKSRRFLNQHRKEDFSHLSFNIKEVSGSGYESVAFKTLYENVGVYEVLSLIKCKLAMETRKFYNRMQFEWDDSFKREIEELCNPEPSNLAFQYFGFREETISNSYGRNFPMVRIQGIEGMGKTTTARKLAEQWINLTKDMDGLTVYKFQESRTLSEFKPLKEPTVYIFDDWITSSLNNVQILSYVNKLNATHKSSVFFLVTNEIIKDLSVLNNKMGKFWSLIQGIEYESPYDCSIYKKSYSGVFRRIGLDKSYYNGQVIINNNSANFNITVSVLEDGIFKVRNKAMTNNMILNLLKDKFIACQEDRFNIIVLNEKPPSEKQQVDFEIYAKSKEELFDSLKTTKGCYNLYMYPTCDLGLKVSERVIKGLMNRTGAIKPSDFICKEIFDENVTIDDKYMTIIARIARVLQYYFADATFRVYIKDTKNLCYCEGNIVYYFCENDYEKLEIVNNHFVLNNGISKIITLEEMVNIMSQNEIEKIFEGNVKLFSAKEIINVKNLFLKMIDRGNSDPLVLECLKKIHDVKFRNSDLYSKIFETTKNNKVLMLAIAGLASVSTITVFYGLYKIIGSLLRETQEETVVDNAFANVGSTPPKRFQEKQKNTMEKKMGVSISKVIPMEQEEFVELEHFYTKGEEPCLYKIIPSDNQGDEKIQIRCLEDTTSALPYSGIEENSVYPIKKSKLKHIYPNIQGNSLKTIKPKMYNKIYPNEERIAVIEEQENTINTPHEHVCFSCNCLYTHVHAHNSRTPHTQFKNQCPNNKCKQYHNGKNTKEAHLIQEDFEHTQWLLNLPNALAIALECTKSKQTTCLKIFLSRLKKVGIEEIYKIFVNEGKEAARSYLTSNYEELNSFITGTLFSNMLSSSDMIVGQELDIEKLHRKLNKSYVCLHHAETMAYGLHVGEGKFLTVSHSFDKVGEQLAVSSQGTKYPGLVIAILRERDIAIVLCNHLNTLPSAMKYFCNEQDELPTEAYFLRCGPTFSVVNGALDYQLYQEYIKGSCSNPNFSPNTEILKIRRMGMMVESMVKKGDCGFPFIACIEGSMRIIGIHNAYKHRSVVYGAFVHKELLEELKSEVFPNSRIDSTAVAVRIPLKTRKEGQLVSMPIEYANAFDECVRPDPYFKGNDYMINIGYHPLFRNFAPPREKYVTHDLLLENPNTTMPAAYSLQYVEDFSELELDKKNRPDPLITQALKYGELPSNVDASIFKHAVEMVKDYNMLTYCCDKKLRILTEFEALNGMKQPFLSSVDINTSAGPYPKYWGKMLTKKDVLEVQECASKSPIYTFAKHRIGQNIKNHLKVQRYLLERYYIPPCLISQDNAKVENIEIEEALKGKVRLFNNVDLAINCILKMYFGNWFARCMEKSESGYYSIGQNPYTTSTEIWHRFNTKTGKILNTDFKRFDKKLPKIFIEAFCEIAESLVETTKSHINLPAVYSALSKTLIYAVHILNGSVYVVENGNESGTFVTTLLNCVSVHIVFNYTFIKFWNTLPQFIYIQPTLRDIMSRSELAILGDDKTQIVSEEIPMTEEFLIKTASELGMLCTPAKGGKDDGCSINFCSRVLKWSEKDQVVFPCLKKTSVIGLLYWFANSSKNQVRDNLMICLFEAALHDRQFYESILRDASKVAVAFGVDIRTVPFTNYENTRRKFKAMLINDFEYQQISALADRETNKTIENQNIANIIKQSLILQSKVERINPHIKKQVESEFKVLKHKDLIKASQLIFKSDSSMIDEVMAKTNTCDNPINKCLEFISKLGKKAPLEQFTRTGPDHTPVYSCTLNFADREFGGEGTSKINAKTRAYGALLIYLDQNIVSNSFDVSKVLEAESKIGKLSFRFFSLYIETHIAKAREISMGKSIVVIINSRRDYTGMEKIDGFYRQFNNGQCFILSELVNSFPIKQTQACYSRYPGVSWDVNLQEVTLDLIEKGQFVLRTNDETCYDEHDSLIVANSSNDANVIGVTENDDPVVAGDFAAMDSEKAMYAPLIMNRAAPSNNWLKAGGITFNAFDLVYHQFVGCNKQVTISDSSAAGTILAQIPYSIVGNEFANAYMQNMALMHGRMTGDWIIKATCPGNPGMQCSVGFGWSPDRLTSTTVTMDVITKYAYFTTGVSQEWSQTIVLSDARKQDFYREIEKKKKRTADDFKGEPHIIVFCETPATSVFTEKKSTTITFFSKFCSEQDILLNPSVKPFVLADPQIAMKYDSTSGYVLNF